MRALILADRSFAARERDLLTRVQVGLIDEGIRVVEALPADLADPDANPLIPTIPYSDHVALLASRARTRRLIRGLQSVDPPLAPASAPFAPNSTSRTSAGKPTIEKITSERSAKARGVAAHVAP